MKFQKVQKLKMVSKPYPTMQKSAPADSGNAQKPHSTSAGVVVIPVDVVFLLAPCDPRTGHLQIQRKDGEQDVKQSW